MTPLGSNLRKGSNPDSHHLGLLSEKKLWSRAKIEKGVTVGRRASFTRHRNRPPLHSSTFSLSSMSASNA